MILIGDKGVGKTTLFDKMKVASLAGDDPYLNDVVHNNAHNDAHHDTHHDTHHDILLSLHREGRTLNTILSDTGDRECCGKLPVEYYKPIHAVIFCFDLSNMETWKNIKYWMKEEMTARTINNTRNEVITV
eukprot:TRINITY_DN8565_c0_g1_i1.p1 TRINITY_DN8565_c0_g1~~TRINITY_DN8565_c0_g1_i1.p1  ORF type:complete len:131 (-),score=14.99 TRINITY_DN8565_c0_g1_i1:10-402(-)